jgi:adenylate cyclase
MQVHLLEGEQARLRYTTTTNVEAWNYWIRAAGAVYRRQLSKEDMAVARINCEKALAFDPGSATLNAILAQFHVFDARFHWWEDRPTALAKATAYVERALHLDPDSPEGHVYSGLIRMLERRFDDAARLARKAVELAPGSAEIAVHACWIFSATGRAREAVAERERAMKLNPIPPPVYFGLLGNAYRLAGRIDDAIATLEKLHELAPEIGGRDLVIAYERAGRHQEARGAAARLLAAQPEFTVIGWIDSQFRSDTSEFEADVAALRAAGLPE